MSRRPGDLRLFFGQFYPDLVKLLIHSGHDFPRHGCDPGRHARPQGPARSGSRRDDLRDGRPGAAGLLPRRRPRDAQHRGGRRTAARLPRKGRRAGDGPDAQLRGHLAPAGAARGRGGAGPAVRAEAEAGPGGLVEGTEVARGRGGRGRDRRPARGRPEHGHRHLGTVQRQLPGGEEPGRQVVRAGQPAGPGEPGRAGRRACSAAGGWAGGWARSG